MTTPAWLDGETTNRFWRGGKEPMPIRPPEGASREWGRAFFQQSMAEQPRPKPARPVPAPHPFNDPRIIENLCHRLANVPSPEFGDGITCLNGQAAVDMFRHHVLSARGVKVSAVDDGWLRLSDATRAEWIGLWVRWTEHCLERAEANLPRDSYPPAFAVEAGAA